MDRDHWKWLFEELSRIEAAICIHRCQCMCHHSLGIFVTQIFSNCTRTECTSCGVCGLGHSHVALRYMRSHLKKCHGIEPVIRK